MKIEPGSPLWHIQNALRQIEDVLNEADVRFALDPDHLRLNIGKDDAGKCVVGLAYDYGTPKPSPILWCKCGAMTLPQPYVDHLGIRHQPEVCATAPEPAPVAALAPLTDKQLYEFGIRYGQWNDPDGKNSPRSTWLFSWFGLMQFANDVRSAAPVAAPAHRTPQDYAIEHAGYLANAAEQYMSAVDEHGLQTLRVEEEDGEADPALVEQAWSNLLDSARALRSCVHEFRKRRDRAAAAPEPAPSAERTEQNERLEELIDNFRVAVSKKVVAQYMPHFDGGNDETDDWRLKQARDALVRHFRSEARARKDVHPDDLPYTEIEGTHKEIQLPYTKKEKP